MTREQIKEQFPDATDDQITAILNINGADIKTWKDKVPKKAEYDELVRKAGEFDKLEEAGLTDEQKIQKALKEANDTKAEYDKKLNKLDAEKILVAAGLTEEDYKDLIDCIVSGDDEITKTMATNLANMVKKQKEAAVQKTKEELMDGTHTPGGSSGGNGEEEPEDVKNAKSITFGNKASEKDVKDYYVLK